MAKYTTQQLADLRAAIAEGALRVRSAGREVEYRSLAEMQELERIMAEELEPGTSPATRKYMGFERY
jgi:arylamine N-acetyltransferase